MKRKTFICKVKGYKFTLKITCSSKKWLKEYLKKDYSGYKFKITRKDE